MLQHLCGIYLFAEALENKLRPGRVVLMTIRSCLNLKET